MKISRILQILGGLAIMGAALWFFLKGVDIDQLALELRSTSPWSILSVAALSVFTLYIRSLRWSILLPRTEGTSRKDLFSLTLIGFMINNIVPARIGEAVRAVLCWRRNKFSATVAVGSIVVERFLDLFSFALILLVSISMLPDAKVPKSLAIPLIVATGGMLITAVLYVGFTGPFRIVASKAQLLLPKRLRKKVGTMAHEATTTLEWLFSLRLVGLVFVLTCATSMCYALMIGLLVDGFTIKGILYGMFAMPFSALGAAVPLTPGYVGTVHAAMQWGLSLVGIEGDAARAVAIVYHAVGYTAVTVVGLVAFFRLNISFKDIAHAKKELEEEENLESLHPTHAGSEE